MAVTTQPFPFWTHEELEKRQQESRALYVASWSGDLQTKFREFEDKATATARELLSETDNLRALQGDPDFFSKRGRKPLVEAARYMTTPRLSEANLKTLSEGESAVGIILRLLNRKRFPWMVDGATREPTDEEIAVAVATTAEMMAAQKFETYQRNELAKQQQDRASKTLSDAGLKFVDKKELGARIKELDKDWDKDKGIQSRNLDRVLERGEFTYERKINGDKCDIPAYLPSGDLLTLECKVSNSEVNTIKRLIRETLGKSKSWQASFGDRLIPAAMISGVSATKTLEDAQAGGVLVFFDHEQEALAAFIAAGGKPRPKP